MKNVSDRIRITVILVLCAIVLVFLLVPLFQKERLSHPFTVRVRISEGADHVNIGSSGVCEIRDAKTDEIMEGYANLPYPTEVRPSGDGIRVGGEVFPSQFVRIASSEGELELNGAVYRGNFDITASGGRLRVVNRVDLEDYLKGVVPCEVNQMWPFAVLKAQAVASRSFAVYKALRRKNKEYDLTDDTYSQVYRGKGSEKWRTTRAVNATRGKILEYKGKVFPAYFHSCCGGHTEDIDRVWKNSQVPLKGRRCRWCAWSPYFRWRAKIPTSDIIKGLNRHGHNIARIDDIRSGERDKSGRLEYVSIKSGNKWFEVDAGDFRSAAGAGKLKSTNFRMKKYPRFYLFTGHGWGHGVGMCQWGALGQAIRRRSAEHILKFYYPGARIARLREILI